MCVCTFALSIGWPVSMPCACPNVSPHAAISARTALWSRRRIIHFTTNALGTTLFAGVPFPHRNKVGSTPLGVHRPPLSRLAIRHDRPPLPQRRPSISYCMRAGSSWHALAQLLPSLFFRCLFMLTRFHLDRE